MTYFDASATGRYEFPISLKEEEEVFGLENSNLAQDTMKLRLYQSFDEFHMRGYGSPDMFPYVKVRRTEDSILVSSSDVKDSTRLYVKIGENIWFNHIEYDMHKRGEMLEKSKRGRVARVYDRYFYNDTITEVKVTYRDGNKNAEIYVKLPRKMFIVNMPNIDSLIYSDVDTLRKYVFEMSQSPSKKIWEYNLIESEKIYSYIGVGHKYNYTYHNKAYGFWGLQPGVEETFLYEDIDIREYADNLQSFQIRNPDFVYRLVDDMPEFPGGYDSFMSFVKNKRNGLLTGNKQVVVEAVVEKDGSMTNITVSKYPDSTYYKDALKVINEMPKWKPGILNGRTARCKIKIPISYRKW